MKSVMTPLLFTLFIFVLLPANDFAQGKFIYIYHNGHNVVTGYSVGVNGAITQLQGSPFSTGALENDGGFIGIKEATAVQVGNHLFVSNSESRNISAFAINPDTGFLTSVTGSPFPTGLPFRGQSSLAATPNGKFLYQGFAGQNAIAGYSIASDGTLVGLAGFPMLVGGLFNIQVSPDGRFLAIAQWFDRKIAMYRIGNDGTIVAVPGSPFPTAGGGNSVGVEFNCAGDLLFGVESRPLRASTPTGISAYRMAANGSLTLVPGSPFIVNHNGNGAIAIGPDDRHLFVSNGPNNSVFAFNIGSDGSLSAVPGSPFANPEKFFTFGFGIDREGTLLYVLNSGFVATLSVYAILPGGALNIVPNAPVFIDSESLTSLVVYPARLCAPARVFDICIQDDGNNNVLRINSTSGDYDFTNCSGSTLSGTGVLTKRGSTITLQQYSGDRRLLVRIDGAVNKATAYIQTQGMNFTITDRNIADDTCACAAH